jgi:hypothetical protein
MTQMQRAAASLTGAAGHVLHTKVIPPVKKSLTNASASPAVSNSPVKTKELRHVKQPKLSSSTKAAQMKADIIAKK